MICPRAACFWPLPPSLHATHLCCSIGFARSPTTEVAEVKTCSKNSLKEVALLMSWKSVPIGRSHQESCSTWSLPHPSYCSIDPWLKANTGIAAAKNSRVDSTQFWAHGMCLVNRLAYLDTVNTYAHRSLNARCLTWKPSFPGRNVGPSRWLIKQQKSFWWFLFKSGLAVKTWMLQWSLCIFQLELSPESRQAVILRARGWCPLLL